MHYKKLFSAIALAVSPAVMAAPGGAADAVSFNPVVVTATPVDQPVTDTLAAVVVVTREDIERLQPQSLMDLLRGLPGVAMANSGGVGQLTSLFVRGTNSSHTLVLVDGIRVASVSAGMPAVAQIPVDQIERIELVRGPRSSLYGADAVGGVLQIFTKRGGEGLQPSLYLSAGSHHSASGQLGVSAGGKHGWLHASVGSQYTRGINSCRLGAGTVFAGCFANEPDTDGYRAHSGVLNGGWRWDSGAELAGNFLRSTSEVEYDGSFQNHSRHAQQVMGARLSLPVTGAWDMTVRAGRSLDKATNFHDQAYTGYVDSTRDTLAWQNNLRMATGQQLVVGVERQNESIDSSTAYQVTERRNTGAFAWYQGRYGAHELQVSLRHDDNQQFGGHATGALAWGYHFAGGTTLSLSWGTSFHAPTFNDLYWPAFPGFPPPSDPQLKPETARNLELALGARHATWYWQVSAYRNTIDDLIALDASFTPGNISRARIQGLEGQLGGRAGAWSWAGYLTLQDPRNVDGSANHANLLPRRFQRSARIELDRAFGRFSLGATLAAFSHRFDDIANRHRLGGFGTVDLRAGWQLAEHWRLQARLGNALDHPYETVYYYNQPGRTVSLGLRYQP